MKPKPDCPDCDGTGWKQVVNDGVEAVERCDCFQYDRGETLTSRAQIPERFREADFDNFSPGSPRENPIAHEALIKVMLGAKAYARDYPSLSQLGLLLQGGTGVGKTHLATAVLRQLLSRGFECVFFDYQTLLDRIRQSYNPAAGAADKQAYRAALDTEVVLIDDLGSHRVTDWVEDTVTAIINHRYNERKALIVTTNLPDPVLGDSSVEKDAVSGKFNVKDTLADRIGVRARSRIYEMCRVIQVPGRDYRLRNVGSPR